jgi:hypothetical protein
MRKIELKRANRYMDMQTGKMFVRGKMYTVGDNIGARLLDQVDAQDDPYFRDHGSVSKAQVAKMLKEQEAKKVREAEARRQEELDNLTPELLDDDPVDEPTPDAVDDEVAELSD